MSKPKTSWPFWGVFTRRAKRLVDARSTEKLAMLAAVGRSGPHTVERIIVTLAPARRAKGRGKANG